MNSNESLDESYTIANENEISPEVLLKPDDNFVRTDNSISSTKSSDLDFCFEIVLKEAVKEEKLVKQIFYTMLSAYTNNPTNLAINAPSGTGKSHALTRVSNLFPKLDTIFIAGMSDKAIFHKNGYIAMRNEEGEYEEVENELEKLIEKIQSNKSKLNKIKETNKTPTISVKEIEQEIEESKQRIKEIEKNAVKVIDLSHKILIFLDTPRTQIFEALMPLLSHDKYEVEYQFVDNSNRLGLRTKTNVLIGWPAVIFAQAIDNSNHERYSEIQRRFAVTNPLMNDEKYQGAIDSIIEKKCLPDFAYQLKVVSDKDKDVARDIILNIKDDLLSFSTTTKPGKNNILIPYTYLLRRIMSKNNTPEGMTFVNRLTSHIVLLTNIHYKKRPYLEITPVFGKGSFRIPMALYSDLQESISLVSNSVGGLRPYVLEWYENVFLKLYNSKLSPNSKLKNEDLMTEQRIAVTTRELIEKTKEVLNKVYTSKSIQSEFIYPLSNLGYIDNIDSELDKRANIYFPVIDLKDERYSNLFLFDKKNNFYDEKKNNNINFITNEDKNQIISKIMDIKKYYSDNGNLVTLRFADADNDIDILPEDNEFRKVEEIVEKYYSEFYSIQQIDKNQVGVETCSITDASSQEEYPQNATNDNILQDCQLKNIESNSCAQDSSNNLFYEEEKNKLIYYCYRCEFETDIQTEYEKHCVLMHPDKPGYPSLSDIQKDGLKPLGKPWE